MQELLEIIRKGLESLAGYGLRNLLPAVGIFALGMIGVQLIMKVLKKALGRTKLETVAVSLICSVCRTAFLVLLSLATASSLGIDVTGIIALASVLTLAVSLAVQNALTNVLGGFTLLHTKPFRMGDYVEVAGQGGTVLQIGLTYTKLETPDGKTVAIPNSSVVAAEIVNYSLAGKRRVDVKLTVSAQSAPRQVMQALLEAAQVPGLLEDKLPYVAISSYNEGSISYILQVWTASSDYWPTLHAIHANIPQAMENHGVALTYPGLQVELRSGNP